MTTADLFEETYWALSANKVRSFLTMLGIIIGVASVIAMVAIGQGSQNSIQQNIQSIGFNLIVVTPGAQRGPGVEVSGGLGSSQTLTMADEEAIAQGVTSVQGIDAELSRRYQITAKGTNTNTQVVGTTSQYPTVRNLTMDSGSFFSDQQVASMAKVAVLGPTAAADLFGAGTNPIGQTIRVNGISFAVVGVTQSKGGSGFFNQDDMVFIPISVAQHYLVGPGANGQPYVSTIAISAQDAASMVSVQQQVTTLLLARHHISNAALADFTVQNQADIVAAASTITNTFTMLLASIAGISLVVGGIGIMNMMLTTVTERTREIGLRKAIGAKRTDISRQFLIEATALTFIGGVAGVLVGWVASWALASFAGLSTQVSLFAVLLSFGVSAGIGIVFGYYPARRAARLNPIDALRYE